MYSRSSAPRSATVRSRSASSSRPISSTWSCVSTTGAVERVSSEPSTNGRNESESPNMSVSKCVMSSESDVEGDVADRDRDTQLNGLVRIGVGVAGTYVLGASRFLHRGAGEADAHPAAVLGMKSGGLGLFQQ